MRRWVATAIVALSVGVFVLSQSSSLAQEQSDENRKILTRANPVYPDLARRMQLGGIVKVEATVAPGGRVKLTRVIGGSPLLTRAAVEAIEKWTWAVAAHETKELIELNFHP